MHSIYRFLLCLLLWGGSFSARAQEFSLAEQAPIFPSHYDMHVLLNVVLGERGNSTAISKLAYNPKFFGQIKGASLTSSPSTVRVPAISAIQIYLAELGSHAEERARLTALYVPAITNILRSQDYDAVLLSLQTLEYTSLSLAEQFHLVLEIHNEVKKNIDPREKAKFTHTTDGTASVEAELEVFLLEKSEELKVSVDLVFRQELNKTATFNYTERVPSVVQLQRTLQGRWACRRLFSK